jgi:hypothetical protein
MKTRRIRNKWLIVQYDDRKIDTDTEILVKENKEYAKKHGYTYKFINSGYTDIPPYWRKVSLVKDLLPNYKGVLWLDTDAVIFDSSKSLESLTKSRHSMFISRDNWRAKKNHFNAGVWMIKNTPDMNTLMSDWENQYKEEDWLRNSDGKWHSKGKWSNITYEQGSFTHNIATKYNKYIKWLPCNILQGAIEDINTDHEPFVIHFMDKLKEHIPAYVKIFITMPKYHL